jgi:hypothetical protein
MLKNKNKWLMLAAVCFLAMAFLFPVYAQSQSGVLQQDRDQDCIPEGPATRAYGEEPPKQAQEEKPAEVSQEEVLEAVEDPMQEQAQTRERLRYCNCENEDCQENQYQYQYEYQYQCEQEED